MTPRCRWGACVPRAVRSSSPREQLAMTRSEAAGLMHQAGRRAVAATRCSRWCAGPRVGRPVFTSRRCPCADRTGTIRHADEFAGDDRFVSEYVREEFLSGLSADETEFLTRSSVLERLSGSLCDAVLEREGSAYMLARLARSNVMLVALDRSQTSYRYHSLFADVLRAELRRREPGREAGLHRRAGEWCERARRCDGRDGSRHRGTRHPAGRAPVVGQRAPAWGAWQ